MSTVLCSWCHRHSDEDDWEHMKCPLCDHVAKPLNIPDVRNCRDPGEVFQKMRKRKVEPCQ
jgi:hypothetical protein